MFAADNLLEIYLSMKFLPVCLTVLLSGGFAAVAEEKHGRGHGHHDFPPTVAEFHDIMAPLWHAPPGAERITSACAETKRLGDHARAIGEGAVPGGVDQAQWAEAAKALLESVSAMDQACADESAVSALVDPGRTDLVRPQPPE